MASTAFYGEEHQALAGKQASKHAPWWVSLLLNRECSLVKYYCFKGNQKINSDSWFTKYLAVLGRHANLGWEMAIAQKRKGYWNKLAVCSELTLDTNEATTIIRH